MEGDFVVRKCHKDPEEEDVGGLQAEEGNTIPSSSRREYEKSTYDYSLKKCLYSDAFKIPYNKVPYKGEHCNWIVWCVMLQKLHAKLKVMTVCQKY